VSALARELLQRTLEHLLLVAIALGLALLITVPLGIWIHRRRWAGWVLAAASTIQTIPSLAIFGLLLTVPLLGGIGPVPAVVALTLYALLPLLRGLVTGLAQVPLGLREAGLALGLREGQVLRRIELPLALPIWMAGMRVATVITVGTATIAAAIGAGGLGVFLFRGIATVNNGLLLAGALPAAALALLADFGLGALERRLARAPRPRRNRESGWSRRRLAAAVAALLAVGLGLAIGLGLGQAPGGVTLRIGAKNFTEQLILAELLSQQIEADTPLRVQRDFGLGGTALLHEGVRSGRLDGYVEYTGTAWTAILGQPPLPGADRRQRVWRQTRSRYADLGLTVFPSLGFENSFALLIRRADAERLGLRRLSQAAPFAPRWRAAFGYEFLNRPDGWPGLARRYTLQLAAPPRAMDLGLTYRALAEGQVDLIAGDSTNGLIQALDLAILADDRDFFPPYDAVPVFRSASLRRHAGLAKAVARLTGRLDATTMQRLNAAVDLDQKPVERVVKDWRRSAGLEGPS
jgi:osmoprotectant transport system permease protein